MKIEKQNFSLPIKNYDESMVKVFQKHGNLFCGGSKRGIIVGASGCGKTNVIISLLEHPNGLRFENVYVYSKSLYQPKYEYLRLLFKPLKEIGYFEFESATEIIPPKEIKPNSIVIFDDIVCCNQNIMREYFCFGRHKNTDCFYLCQTYTAIPKQLLRDNSNLLIIFRQDNTNLRNIYYGHVNTDMSFQEFQEMCAICWQDKFGFLVIDKDCDIKCGRYRKGFDRYIILN